MYKISKGLVPAIPSTEYLTKIRVKRTVKANPKYTCKNYETINFVERHQNLNDNCYKTISATSTVYKNSFFPRTIGDWNQLGNTSQPTLESFKRSLRVTKP